MKQHILIQIKSYVFIALLNSDWIYYLIWKFEQEFYSFPHFYLFLFDSLIHWIRKKVCFRIKGNDVILCFKKIVFLYENFESIRTVKYTWQCLWHWNLFDNRSIVPHSNVPSKDIDFNSHNNKLMKNVRHFCYKIHKTINNGWLIYIYHSLWNTYEIWMLTKKLKHQPKIYL